jgi:hypothetical protein
MSGFFVFAFLIIQAGLNDIYDTVIISGSNWKYFE